MVDELRKFINSNKFNRIGITGGAGSGKTFLSECLMIPYTSTDNKFIGDSQYRKALLEKKNYESLDSYIDACNQYNWWNWEDVEKDYVRLLETHGGRGILEGAILGPDSIVKYLDAIFFLNIPQDKRFSRLREREGNKRDFYESMIRFMITEFSENLYYIKLITDYYDKIYYIDENYEFTDKFKVNPIQHVPVIIRVNIEE